MATSYFLCRPPSPSSLCPKPISSVTHTSFFTLNPRRPLVTAQSNRTHSPDAPDRLISALSYFYPFFDGVDYGNHVLSQFSVVDTLLQPLSSAIRAYQSFPVANGLLVFFTLYFAVVRNPNFSRYVRFNAMQAILLDVLLIVPTILGFFNLRDVDGLDLMMSFDSTVFWFLFICLIYGSCSCLLGRVPRLPILADVADLEIL